jgi:predicted CopG family antitoxin
MASLTKQSLKGRKNLNVSDETYDRLKKHGMFGESFDELINRILNENDEHKGKSKK